MFQLIEWIKRSRPAAGVLFRAGALTLVVAGATYYTASRYGIAFDPQAKQCLPGTRVYLVDRQAKEIHRGDIAVFAARGLGTWIAQGHPAVGPLAPSYRDGKRIVKRVAGVPGDRVEVTADEVRVNGERVGEGLDLAATLARPVHTFIRTETVPRGMYWFMGLTRDSFDSRYWGYVAEEQIVGKAYPIF